MPSLYSPGYASRIPLSLLSLLSFSRATGLRTAFVSLEVDSRQRGDHSPGFPAGLQDRRDRGEEPRLEVGGLFLRLDPALGLALSIRAGAGRSRDALSSAACCATCCFRRSSSARCRSASRTACSARSVASRRAMSARRIVSLASSANAFSSFGFLFHTHSSESSRAAAIPS